MTEVTGTFMVIVIVIATLKFVCPLRFGFLWLKISGLIRTLILDGPVFARKVKIVTVTGLVTETVKVFSSSSVFLYLIWFWFLPGL